MSRIPTVALTLVLCTTLLLTPSDSRAGGFVPPGFGPEIEIGGFGTVPAFAFTKDGFGHLVYRRDRRLFYRHFDRATHTWSEEIRINDDNSRIEDEFLDRNQPKLTVEPETGSAWVAWGGDIRDQDKNLYLRGITPDGQIATEIHKYRYLPDILRPEDIAVSFDPERKRVHLYATLIGDPTEALDGHYDFVLGGNQQLNEVVLLGPPQKNIFGFTGPNFAYAFARLHQVRWFRSGGTEIGGYDQYGLHPERPRGELGAFRPYTTDDRIAHFGVVSTCIAGDCDKRDATYYALNMDNENFADEVIVDPSFESPHGLVQPAVTEKGHIFLTWDKGRLNEDEDSSPAYAYRLRNADPDSSFSLPRFFPNVPAKDTTAEAPAPAPWGERVYVVWGDRRRSKLYYTWFDFEDPPTPTRTPTRTFTATPLATNTPTVTRTPSFTATPSATPTPLTLPGGSPSEITVDVRDSDLELEVAFRVVSPSIPVGCTVTVEVRDPDDVLVDDGTGATYGFSLPDPEAGAWTVSVSSSQSCPAFRYYLSARAVPMVSVGPLLLLALALGSAGSAWLRRRRR